MVSAARALEVSRARRGAIAVATTWAGRVATEGFGSRQASPYQFADVALSLDARKTCARAPADPSGRPRQAPTSGTAPSPTRIGWTPWRASLHRAPLDRTRARR